MDVVSSEMAGKTTVLRCPVLNMYGLRLLAPEAHASQPQVGAVLDGLEDVTYPLTSVVVDITKPPYYAKGDGLHDDTDAIQREFATR